MVGHTRDIAIGFAETLIVVWCTGLWGCSGLPRRMTQTELGGIPVEVCASASRFMPIHSETVPAHGVVSEGCFKYALDPQAMVRANLLIPFDQDDDVMVINTGVFMHLPAPRQFPFVVRSVDREEQWRAHDAAFLNYWGIRRQSSAVHMTTQHHANNLTVDVDMLYASSWNTAERRLIQQWVDLSIKSALMLGVNPHPKVKLTLIRKVTHGGYSNILMGAAGHGTVPGIVVLMAEELDGRLLKDWVLVHEWVHTMTPRMPSDEAMYAEGLATYLQERLRQKSGMITNEEAESNLRWGFHSIQTEGEGTFIEESKTMHQTRRYQRVYWAGAYFFFELERRLALQGFDFNELVGRWGTITHTQTRPYRLRELASAWPEDANRICNAWMDAFEQMERAPLR